MAMEIEQLDEFAKKIKDNIATDAEKVAFFKKINELFEELRALTKKS